MKTNFNMADEFITMMRGDTLSFGVVVSDQAGQPLDLDTAFMTCKKNFTDEEPIFQKSLEDGITKDSDGKYVVRVAPNDTKDVEAGIYFYDLQIGANGDVYTVLRGYLKLEWDVTD